MGIEERVRSYYRALAEEEPLPPYFAAEPTPVKFGITETLVGYDEIAAGLRHQTDTTTDWTVESRDLRSARNGRVGWFSDHVRMAWRNEVHDRRIDRETRWSGTLVERDDEWLFVRMHVSATPDGGL